MRQTWGDVKAGRARNRYFPRWLEWLPEIHIEGAAVQAPAPVTARVGAGAK